MIPQRDVSKASVKDRVSERTVEKDYAIHWIMLGLASTPLHSKLLFKGGTSLRLCRFEGYRYSEDIDLTAIATVTPEQAGDAFIEAGAWAQKRCGLKATVVARSVVTATDGFSFQVTYSGPLGAQLGQREIKVDVNAHEKICFDGEERPVFGHYSDLPRKPLIRCYALEEVVCEKFRSVLNPARKEPRDIYDLWHLSLNAGVAIDEIAHAFREKAEFKGLDPDALVPTLKKKEKVLAALWEKRLKHQVAVLPPFGEAFKQALREAKKLAE
jgi:hypothetical protein